MEIFYFVTKYVQSRLLQNCHMRERVKLSATNLQLIPLKNVGQQYEQLLNKVEIPVYVAKGEETVQLGMLAFNAHELFERGGKIIEIST